MKNYNELVENLETLTIEDLKKVENNVMKYSEKKPLTDTALDEFIKNKSNKEYSDVYDDYYSKLGLIALEKTIKEIIYDKTKDQLFKEMIAYKSGCDVNNIKKFEEVDFTKI